MKAKGKLTPTCLLLDDETRAELKKRARARGVSTSSFLRWLIHEIKEKDNAPRERSRTDKPLSE